MVTEHLQPTCSAVSDYHSIDPTSLRRSKLLLFSLLSCDFFDLEYISNLFTEAKHFFIFSVDLEKYKGNLIIVFLVFGSLEDTACAKWKRKILLYWGKWA